MIKVRAELIKSVMEKGKLESEELAKIREFNESRNESRRKKQDKEREIEREEYVSRSSSDDNEEEEKKDKDPSKLIQT